MRKLIILILVVSVNCFAQNKQILYNFTSVPQSLLTNPGADVNYSWYVGVPLLSGISANVGSSGFSAYDLFADNGVDFNTKLRNVVFSTSRKDKAVVNEQLEIFSGGFKLGDWQEEKATYVSFGVYQELDALAYMPKDYVILALDGNKDYLGKVFDISDLNTRAELLSVFHIGFHKKLSDKLIFGARGKIYSSIYNVSSTKNSGYFYTIRDENSVYEQVISSNIQVDMSGLTNYTNTNSQESKTAIAKKALLGGNLGLGLDLGLTYYPKKNIQFTASLSDIGFVKHTKDVENYTYKGYYNYKGLTPNFILDGSNQSLSEEFEDALPLDTINQKYTTWRPLKFNSSIQYSFGDGRSSDCNCQGNEIQYKNSVGAQLFAMTTPRTPLMALTAYYRRQILKSLEMKATYTVDSFSSKNIGLGLSTTIGKVNFYLMADNLLEYRDISKANSLSFQLGINIIFPDKNSPD